MIPNGTYSSARAHRLTKARVELLVSDFEVAVDRIAFSDQELTKIWQRALARQQLTHVQSSRLPDPKPVPVVFPDGTERLGLEIEDGLLEVASAPETMQTQRLVLLIGGERRLVRAIRNQLRNGELTARIRHEKAP
ncbi:MAG: hypothetical protein ACRENP_19380 [Longimicrobiales bacterium]